MKNGLLLGVSLSTQQETTQGKQSFLRIDAMLQAIALAQQDVDLPFHYSFSQENPFPHVLVKRTGRNLIH